MFCKALQQALLNEYVSLGTKHFSDGVSISVIILLAFSKPVSGWSFSLKCCQGEVLCCSCLCNVGLFAYFYQESLS